MPGFRAYPQVNDLESTDLFLLDRIGEGTRGIDGGVLADTILSFATVDSIADLRDVLLPFPRQRYVQGYYTPGDGGQGVFTYDPSDTTSPDNGGTVIVDDFGRRWKRSYTGAFIPQWFGARVDGVRGLTGACTSGDTTLTDPNASFTQADVGKLIGLVMSITAAGYFITTIASVNSSTSIELTTAPPATVANFLDYLYGSDDAGAWQRLIDAAPDGSSVFLASGFSTCGSVLAGRSNFAIRGPYTAPGLFVDPATIVALHTDGALIQFPPALAISMTAVGWTIQGVGLYGYGNACIDMLANERGSFNFAVKDNFIYRGYPGIKAATSYECYIRDNGFVECGQLASPTRSKQSAIYLFNGAVNIPGANCNSWHITGNFIDNRYGRALDSDSSGLAFCNSYIFFIENHVGPHAATAGAMVYGALDQSIIANNTCEGVGPTENIITLVNENGSGRNTVIGNYLAVAGPYHIESGNDYDQITSNSLTFPGSSGYYIHLTSTSNRCNVTGNVTSDNDAPPPVDNAPCVNDQGTQNSVYMNGGLNGRTQRWLVSTPFTTVGVFSSDDDSSAFGPVLQLQHQRPVAAPGDGLGWIQYLGSTDTGLDVPYAAVAGQVVFPTNGAHDGQLNILLANSGALTQKVTIQPHKFKTEDPANFLATTVFGLGAYVGAAGDRAFVTDGSVAASGNFGAVVAGGGANGVPVYYDGANWRIG